MKIYVVMHHDRHAGTEPIVFSTPKAAIEYAGHAARGCATRPDDYQEGQVEGYLFYARYSPEGDAVWVVEKNLDLGQRRYRPESPLQTRLARYLAKRLLGDELDLMLADHWEFPEIADDIIAIIMTWSKQQAAAKQEAIDANAAH